MHKPVDIQPPSDPLPLFAGYGERSEQKEDYPSLFQGDFLGFVDEEKPAATPAAAAAAPASPPPSQAYKPANVVLPTQVSLTQPLQDASFFDEDDELDIPPSLRHNDLRSFYTDR